MMKLVGIFFKTCIGSIGTIIRNNPCYLTRIFPVRRFTEITTEITSDIILSGPRYGCFSNIKSCTVDIRY